MFTEEEAILEGATRINPVSNKTEFFDPSGNWVPVSSQENITPGVISTKDAEVAIEEDKEKLNIDTSGEEVKTVKVIGPDGTHTIDVNDLQNFIDKGFKLEGTTGGLTSDELSALGIGDGQEKTPEVIALEEIISDLSTESEELNTELDALKSKRDEVNNSLIDSIKANYAEKKVAMEDINKRSVANLKKMGIRTKSLRYSTGFQGIVSSEEAKGIQRVKNLDNEMNILIAEAKQAQLNKEYGELHDKMLQFDKKQAEKVDELKSLYKLSAENNKKITEAKNAVKKTTAVIDVFNEGVSDPFEIYTRLNIIGDEEYVSLDEINKILDQVEIDKEGEADFTNLQKLKLEQGGLLDASRKEQLDFLLESKDKELSRTDTQSLKVMGLTGKSREDVDKMSDEEFASTLYGEKEEKPLSLAQIERYKEEYPDAGVELGDTITVANQKVKNNKALSLSDMGFEEGQIKDINESSESPGWFKDAAELEYDQVFSLEDIKQLWTVFRSNLLGTGEVGTSEEGGELEGKTSLETLKEGV